MRKDLIMFFGGLGALIIGHALVVSDFHVKLIDVVIGLVCFALAYLTRHAEVEE